MSDESNSSRPKLPDSLRSGKPRWRTGGEEPDYRFSLANERTFLAWIRTALAILAAGVLLDQLSFKLQPRVAVTLVAIGLCLVAAALCVLAYTKWRLNERAMRHKLALPHSRALAFLAWAMLLVAGALAGFMLAMVTT